MAQQLALPTLTELEERIERGLETFVDVGLALMEVRDRRLYREAGYPTFEKYCIGKWDFKRHRAYQLIEAAQTVKTLSLEDQNVEHVQQIPESPRINPRQARELAPLAKADPDAAREVWQEVQEQHGDKVTAEKVREAVRERMPQPEPERHYTCPECGDEWTTKQAARECCQDDLYTAFDESEWTNSQRRRARQAVEELPAHQREVAILIATTDADAETTIKRLEQLTKASAARRLAIINEAGNDLDSAIGMIEELVKPVAVERVVAIERAIEFLESTYRDYDDVHAPQLRALTSELRKLQRQMTAR